MTEQLLTVIDMRKSSRKEMLVLSEALLSVSKLLSQQGLRLEVRKSVCNCDHSDRLCPRCIQA